MVNDLLHSAELQTSTTGNGHDPAFPVEEKILRERSVARWQLVWNSRQFLLRVSAIGLVISAALALIIPARYRSTTRLMPPDQDSSGMGLAMLAASSMSGGTGSSLTSQLGSGLGSVAGDLLGIKNSSDLFVGVLHSRTVQDDLINKFNLKKEYWDRKIEDARDDLDARTDFSTDRKSGIIIIEVTDHNAKQAAAMAQEYVNELNQVVVQLNTSSAHRERVFLENRLLGVKDDLESAEKNFSVFASKNTTIDMQSQAKAMLEAGAALQGQLIAAQTELQGLRQIYSDGNVRVRSIQARVDELQRQLKKIGGTSDETASAPDQSGSELYPSIRKLPLLGVSYADLYRSTKVQETLFEVLTREYELAKVQEAKETPSIKVLDPPDIPQKRSFPPRLAIIVLGTVFSLVGGIFFLFGRKSWDGMEEGDTRKALALEVYGSVRSCLKASSNGSGGVHNGSGGVDVAQSK